MTATSPPQRRFLGIAMISAAVLLFEILVRRIFSRKERHAGAECGDPPQNGARKDTRNAWRSRFRFDVPPVWIEVEPLHSLNTR